MAHKALFRNCEVSPVKMKNGDGIFVFDENGKRYIDAVAGTFNLSLGYSNKKIIKAAMDQADRLLHCSSSYTTDPTDRLALKLIETSPSNLSIAHTKVSSGSVAIEGAIKLAQFYTKKEEVICFYRSHHGQTIYTQAMSGFSFRRKPFQFSVGGVHHVPFPYYYQSNTKSEEDVSSEVLRYIDETVKYASKDSVAAIVIEPILGNGGNLIPSKAFLTNLRNYCNKNEIVLIFDEVQTGVGRTGYMYASDYFGVKPDIMAVAKGLGGTGFQIAAILMEEKFNIMPAYLHSFTYGSNLMSSAAGLETLNIISQQSFLDNVKLQGNYFKKRLIEMQGKYEFIGDVRGVGLMIGVEVVENKKNKVPNIEMTNAIAKKCFDSGLIIRTSEYGKGNVFKIRPALNINKAEACLICDVLDRVLSGFLNS